MDDFLSRNILFWGDESQKKVANFHIAVFGLGGVGGFCAETLARSGVGELTIIDFDKVSTSNINRQLIALNSTIGRYKTDLFKQRLLDINPSLKLNVVNDFYIEDFNFDSIDYVADAIDTMRSKVNLMRICYEKNVPLISSMGAGNRIDPTKLYISDISEIRDKKAPFVSNILYQLKKLGITTGISVVTSDEKPFSQQKISEVENVITKAGEKIQFNKIIPSSTPFVASCAGIFMAYKIVSDIINS